MALAPVFIVLLTSFFYDSLLVNQLLFLLASLGLFPDLRLRVERGVIVAAVGLDFYLPNEGTPSGVRYFNFLLLRVSHNGLFLFF